MPDEPSKGVPTGWTPTSEDDHWMICPTCGVPFDMRKPENIGLHIHDASGIEFVETFGPPKAKKPRPN